MNSPLVASTALLALLSCQASRSGVTVYEEIGALVDHGEFAAAVEQAAELVRRNPRDAEAQDAHRRASAAFLMEQGRRATFEDRDEVALEFFERAVEISPAAYQPGVWLTKTRQKIGLRWYIKARDLHLAEELEAALDAYEKALANDETLQEAREGMSRLLIQMNYRAGLGDDYYIEGVRALREYWLQVARSRFSYSTKYGEDSRADRRVDEVDRLLSQQRMAVARGLEADRLFHAARNEYHVASLLDEDNEEAIEARERMAIESEATRKADAAEMAILRGEHDRARELIEEGLTITVEQKPLFEEKLEDIDDARARVKYEHALDLEHDFQYPEAILAYEELLGEREWFEDSRARLSTLQEYVVKAAELYEEARGTQSAEEKVDLLRQIQSFWPEYRDTLEQLRTLDPEGL